MSRSEGSDRGQPSRGFVGASNGAAAQDEGGEITRCATTFSGGPPTQRPQ